jgi:hypothetical protein
VGHWWTFLLIAIVIGIAVYGYFRWDRRYRGAAGPPEQFQATPETFRDPTTGKMMRVYFNPATGARQYREEG